MVSITFDCGFFHDPQSGGQAATSGAPCGGTRGFPTPLLVKLLNSQRHFLIVILPAIRMFRLSLVRTGLRAGSLLKHVPSVHGSFILGRQLAWLTADNEFLPNLLVKDGLLKYTKGDKGLKPHKAAAIGSAPLSENVEEKVQLIEEVETGKSRDGSHYLLFNFTVDRNNALIKSTILVSETVGGERPEPMKYTTTYPPYSSETSSPSLKEPVFSDPRKQQRLKDVANNLWRSFCTNDFIFLTLAATMHADETVSIRWCTAQVDESAVHRQPEIFKHVQRTELPDELEAENSLLVYRKFPKGNLGTIGNFSESCSSINCSEWSWIGNGYE